MDPVFSLTNPTFKYFLGYSAVLMSKIFATNITVGNTRVSNKAYLNEEDAKSFGIGTPDGKPKSTPTIDRLKRIVMNDLENIVPFVIMGLLYVATRPDPDTALLHFRVFTASRLVHTCIYYMAIPQPARASAFGIGFIAMCSMTYQVFRSGALW